MLRDEKEETMLKDYLWLNFRQKMTFCFCETPATQDWYDWICGSAVRQLGSGRRLRTARTDDNVKNRVEAHLEKNIIWWPDR